MCFTTMSFAVVNSEQLKSTLGSASDIGVSARGSETEVYVPSAAPQLEANRYEGVVSYEGCSISYVHSFKWIYFTVESGVADVQCL